MKELDQDFNSAILDRDFVRAARLLQQGANINLVMPTMTPDERGIREDSTTCLLDASSRGDAEAVRFLLENGADPNIATKFESQTALLIAVRHGHAEVVDLLLDHGADHSAVDHPGKLCALDYAIDDERAAIVRSLLAAGARPVFRRLSFNLEGGAAAREIVRMLIEHGFDVNRKDDWGRTPLMWAAERAPMETIQFLIDCGADVNIIAGQNMNGVSGRETALLLAARAARRDVVALLRLYGASEASFVARVRKLFRGLED